MSKANGNGTTLEEPKHPAPTAGKGRKFDVSALASSGLMSEEIIKFEPGEGVQGNFLGYSQAVIEDNGEDIEVTYLRLREETRIAKVKENSSIKSQTSGISVGESLTIVFVGEEKTRKGYKVHQFRVYRDPSYKPTNPPASHPSDAPVVVTPPTEKAPF